MLTRNCVIVGGLAIACGVVFAPTAEAAAGGECAKRDVWGTCLVWIKLPEVPKSPKPPNGKPVSNPKTGGSGRGSGPVVDGHPCIAVVKADPQPGKADPVWRGHSTGAIYTCVYLAVKDAGEVQHTATVSFWAGAAPKAPTPPDPAVLAREAVASMDLRAVSMGLAPKPTAGSVGVVGMPNWMWVQAPSASTWGPITRSASARGFTVTATAKVSNVVWDMGDGQRVTCGQGSVYRVSYGKRSSPTCGHVYTRQGSYPVSATSHWVVAWAGIGQSGTIAMDLTQRATLQIGEVQVLTQ